MKKVIEEYYCDCCEKQVESKDKLYYHDIYLYDDEINRRLFATHGNFCKECNNKYNNDLKSIIKILSNHYGNDIKKDKEEEDDLL